MEEDDAAVDGDRPVAEADDNDNCRCDCNNRFKGCIDVDHSWYSHGEIIHRGDQDQDKDKDKDKDKGHAI